MDLADADADAANRLQLRDLARRVRAAPSQPRTSSRSDVDAAFAEFERVCKAAARLCRELLGDRERGGGCGEEAGAAGVQKSGRGRVHGRTASAVSAVSAMTLSISRRGLGANGDAARGGAAAGASEGPEVLGPEVTPSAARDARPKTVAVVDGLPDRRGNGDAMTAAVLPMPVDFESLEAVREWRACLEELVAAYNGQVAETDKADERSKWETTQTRNHATVICELLNVEYLVRSAESAFPPNRTLQECIITPRADAVLEFANTAMHKKPVLRFRVSSHMLAETSPIFARMFSRHAEGSDVGGQPDLADDLADDLPPPPTRLDYSDGSSALLYRMPQLEPNEGSSLTILLHAAHMHNDRVPREITFERFVAIAEVALRYRCTSPLELFVEHRWLPQWMHKATDDMPDGLVMISYVFGLRRLFTRVTKTVILNLVDEQELAAKNWPSRIKEKIWALRCAKMAQVFSSCTGAIEEYLRPPKQPGEEEDESGAPEDVGSDSAQTAMPVSSAASVTSPLHLFAHTSTTGGPGIFTSTPRCPKGSHWCDATNLGWLMLVYNELQLLSSVLHPDLLVSRPDLACQVRPPARSLAQIVDALRGVTSPLNPVHPGPASVCDPVPALRAAVNDVYNSVAGLTLFDVDGTRHGWALSRRRRDKPQAVLRTRGLDERSDLSRDGVGMRGLDERSDVSWDGVGMATGDPEDSDGGSITGEAGAVEPSVSAAEEVLSDGELCLGILAVLDSFGDLHAASMVNRGVHEVYKKHELTLMRNIIRASRASTDRAPDGQLLSPRPENTMRKVTVSKDSGGPHDAANPTRSSDHTSGLEEIDSAGRKSVQSRPEIIEGAATEPSTQTTSQASPYSRPANDTPSPLDPMSTMTEEEARRIIWPPEPSLGLPPQLSVPYFPTFQPDDMADLDRGKCKANEIVRIEDKTLVVVGNKQLREDLDRRVGLIS